MDLASMRPGVKLAGFALVLALALTGGAVVGAAVPEQRTGGSGHDMTPDMTPATTAPAVPTTAHGMEGHG